MKRYVAALAALVLALGCRAEGLMLPEGTAVIESEAFCGVPAASVFIPESCAVIAPDAFSDALKTVIGVRDSAAESFALSTGREFIDAGIYDAALTCPEVCAPDAKINVKAEWVSDTDTEAEYSLWQDGVLISASADGTLRAGLSGAFTVKIKVTNAYMSRVFTFEDAVRTNEDGRTLTNGRTLTMPLRRTEPGGIDDNLERINAVKQSAMDELCELYERGLIGQKELAARQKVIENAFTSYALPWMTLSLQPYWSEEKSDGGVKDFRPGVVYYGLPYISGDYDYNRAYTVERAVNEGRYVKAEGEKYYLLAQDNLRSGNYVGCDCSTLVGLAYYGLSNEGKSSRTGTLAYTGKFRTLAENEDLYPGDIIVSANRHVVMFLYYANDAHTRIVTIEQGGDEKAVNTVSASVHALYYYLDNGFIARRNRYW